MVTVSASNEAWVERLKRALGDEASLPETPPAAQPVTVLVLDDDPVDRRAMTRALGEIEGVGGVREAATISEAARILADGEVEVAFFDFRLPDGESLALMPQARERGVTVVVVTGAGNERVAVQAMSSGAVGYLIKDVAGEYLTLLPAKFSQHLRGRALEKERAELLRRIEEALEMVRFMGSFVCMCCVCKKIKVAQEKWESIESYIAQRSSTQFSHGYCPTCFEKIRSEMDQS